MVGKIKGAIMMKSSKVKTILMILLLDMVGIIGAFSDTYYVDSQNGNNQNSGLSIDNAWATLGIVKDKSFSAGDSILLKRGSIFTNFLVIPEDGTQSNPIYIGDYGIGNKPILDGNGTIGSMVVTRGANNYIIENIVVRNSSNSALMINNDDGNYNLVFRNIEVYNAGNNALQFSNGGSNILVSNIHVENASNCGIWLGGSPNNKLGNVIVENCFISKVIHNDGITIHEQYSSTAGENFILRNNYVEFCGEQGFDLTTGSNITLIGNTTKNNDDGGILINLSTSDIEVTRHHSIDEPVQNTSAAINIMSSNVKVTNSIFEGSGYHLLSMSKHVGTVEIYNNSFIQNTSNSIMDFGIASGMVYFKNNIFTTSNDQMGRIRFLNAETPMSTDYFVFDNNLYYKPSGSVIFYDASSGKNLSFEDIRTKFGQEANGMETDPKFENIQEHYRLSAESPCIDAGASLDIGYDFENKPVPVNGALDIGAIEFGEDGPPPSNNKPVLNNLQINIADTLKTGNVIATITGSDVDAGQELTYAIVSGNTDNMFTLNASSGQLAIANPDKLKDFDVASLSIRATDNGDGPLSDDATITVNIQHIKTASLNSAPIIEDQRITVTSNADAANAIGSVVANDPDPDQTIEFSIIAGNSNEFFTIDAHTGVISFNNINQFEFEQSGEYIIMVSVKDDEGAESSASIIIDYQYIPLIIYIDPENNDPLEDGTLEHPFNSWADVTWTDGYEYLQKRGTIANEKSIGIGAGNITLGAYGAGSMPVIQSSASDHAFNIFEKSNITIQNLNIKAPEAVSCIYFLGSSCDNNTIKHCEFSEALYGLRLIEGKEYTIKYNTFINEADGIYSLAGNLKVIYNIFNGNSTGLNIASFSSEVSVYNNVFYDNVKGVSSSYASLTLYNNIFYLTKEGDQAINQQIDDLISDHNIFYPEQDGFIEVKSVSYDSFDNYQKSTGLDMNSFCSDPMFVDVYNANFNLTKNSPANENGKLLQLTEDFYGVNVPSGETAEIGIAETNYEKSNFVSVSQNLAGEVFIQYKVFPNPSNGYFKLSFNQLPDKKPVKINIIDLAGRTVHSSYISMSDFNAVNELDLRHLGKGTYNLSVESENKSYNKMIIIQ